MRRFLSKSILPSLLATGFVYLNNSKKLLKINC